jgi:N-acetylmuramoyl-L-alanine amidase
MIHKVKQGEHLTSIASMYGFRDFRTVWLHPDNSELRALRRNPNLLFPGDEVSIPEKQQKSEPSDTGKLHRFQIKGQKLLLQIIVQDINANARRDTFYLLKVHEDVFGHNTDAKGMTKDKIEDSDRDGELLLDDPRLLFRLKIGHLNPLIESPETVADEKERREAIAGWQDRLNNLGYFAGYTPTNDRQLHWAIEEFQCEHGWNPVKGKKPTGKTDHETRDKLEEVHGC